MATAKKKRCPGCTTEVDISELNCPCCQHSWASEDDAGIPSTRHGRGLGPLPWIAGVIAIGFGIWQAINFVIKNADGSASSKDNAIQAFAEAHQREVPAAQRAAVRGGEVVVTPQAPPPSQAPAPEEPGSMGDQLVIAQSQRSEPQAKEWRLRGNVYDLLTLKPVKRATLTLKDNETNQSYETVTDAQGRYRTILPSLPEGGYYVSISHPDYAQSYADPSMLGMQRKSWDDRKEMAQQLQRSLDPPSQVQGWGKKPVVTDFYLAPKKGDY